MIVSAFIIVMTEEMYFDEIVDHHVAQQKAQREIRAHVV